MDLTFAFDPILVQLGPLQLAWHGIFTAVAALVAVAVADRLARRRGLPTDVVHTVATWGFVGGIIGARLFHVADHLDFFIRDPLRILAIWEGGIAVYGAFIGGLIGGGIAAWRIGTPGWPLLDVAAPAMLVGQAIGRLGCLANGDAWGAPTTDCAWCVTIRYTHPNDLLPAEFSAFPRMPIPCMSLRPRSCCWLCYGSSADRSGGSLDGRSC